MRGVVTYANVDLAFLDSVSIGLRVGNHISEFLLTSNYR